MSPPQIDLATRQFFSSEQLLDPDGQIAQPTTRGMKNGIGGGRRNAGHRDLAAVC